MSQPELAVAAGMGVSTVSNMERGEHGANIDSLFAIGCVLGKDPAWFLDVSIDVGMVEPPPVPQQREPVPSAIQLPDEFFVKLLEETSGRTSEVNGGVLLERARKRLGISIKTLASKMGRGGWSEVEVKHTLSGRRPHHVRDVARGLGITWEPGTASWSPPDYSKLKPAERASWCGKCELYRLLEPGISCEDHAR